MPEYPPNEITRRQVLTTSLKTAGAAAVSGTVLNSALAAGVHAKGNETIKVALVGCGSRGAGAVSQALKTEGPIKLWAMADLFEDRLESSLGLLIKGEKAEYDREAYQGLGDRIDVPKERRFIGFDAYQKAIDSGADMVILTTHPHFRPAHFEYAVEQGKHVFMEKPVAVDAPGVRQLLAINEKAKKKNLKVSVGLMSRHDLRYQETVKRIHDGAIGEIEFMRCYWNRGLLRDTPARPNDMSEMLYQLQNPYHFLWLSGDYFVDALIHNIDLCLWAKGSYPVTAQGQGGRQHRSEAQHGDTFDHHVVEYTFEDGVKFFAQTRQIPGCWSSSEADVHGTKGTSAVHRASITGTEKWRFRGRSPNPYQVELDVFIDAIRNNKPHNEAEYGALSTMTAIMGRMASYSGQMVTWEKALNSTVSLAPQRYAFDGKTPVVAGENGWYPVAIPGASKVY